MAKTITVNDFGGGMSGDVYAPRPGEFSQTRNFDTLTYPTRLYPVPSMAADTANTGVQNMIIAPNTADSSTLYVYGQGYEPSTLNGSLWESKGGSWSELTTSRSGDGVTGSNLLIDYPSNTGGTGTGRTLIYGGSNNRLIQAHKDGASALVYQALTGTVSAISQGYVHPADDCLYLGYSNATATYLIKNNAGVWTDQVLTLPKKYTIISINKWGNSLAIGVTANSIAALPGTGVDTSGIFIWDRVQTTWNDFIPLGDVSLFALNLLDGILVACCVFNDNDYGSLIVKGYGGGEVQPLKEIIITRQVASETPTFTNYPKVNFIRRNRMCFSLDLFSGATSPIYKGLWSVGKNKKGQWVVQPERFASTDGSEVSVLAAAYRFDQLFAAHTAAGTLTKGIQSTSGWATEYASAAYYESVVNPDMPLVDRDSSKQLIAAGMSFIMPTTGQVVLKYRIDSVQTGAWTTLFTKTATTPDTSLIYYEAPLNLTGVFFEFRLESTGYAQPLSFSYKYQPKVSNV